MSDDEQFHRDKTHEHDPDPQAKAGKPVAYDWDDDPDRKGDRGGDPDARPGAAT